MGFKPSTSAVALVACCLSISGCDWGNKIDDFNNQLNQMRQTLANSADTIAVAVPGERYARLIDEVHGGDQEKKAEAQAFIRSLFGVDLTDAWSYTVWFSYPKGTSRCAAPKVAVFRAPGADSDQIVGRDKVNAINLAPPEVSRFPLDDRAYLKVVSNAADSILADISNILNVSCGFSNVAQYQLCLIQKREDTKSRTQASLKTILDQYNNSGGEGTLSFPWPLEDFNQTLFVLVSEDDWKCLGNDLTVKARIHKAKETQTPYTRDVEFKPVEFVKNGPVATKYFGNVRWASRTMTDVELDPALADRGNQVRVYLQKSQNKPQKK